MGGWTLTPPFSSILLSSSLSSPCLYPPPSLPSLWAVRAAAVAGVTALVWWTDSSQQHQYPSNRPALDLEHANLRHHLSGWGHFTFCLPFLLLNGCRHKLIRSDGRVQKKTINSMKSDEVAFLSAFAASRLLDPFLKSELLDCVSSRLGFNYDSSIHWESVWSWDWGHMISSVVSQKVWMGYVCWLSPAAALQDGLDAPAQVPLRSTVCAAHISDLGK